MSDEMMEAIGRSWGWILAMGIVMVFLGTLGLGATFMVTMATMFFFGVLMKCWAAVDRQTASSQYFNV